MWGQIFFLAFVYMYNVNCDQLLQAQILFRHGARNQIYKNWNWQEYQDIMEYLTPVGERQQYVLGQWLRKRYITDLQLLSPNLDQNEIQIVSTDVNRTIMSALSNLYGFYPLGTGPLLPDNVDPKLFLPPNADAIAPEIGLYSTPELFQPVPIKMLLSKQDIYLRSYSSQTCPAASVFQANNDKTPLFQQVEDYSKPLKQRYGKEMGLSNQEIEALTVQDLSYQQDTFTVDTFNGYPLPEGLTQQTKDQLGRLQTVQMSLHLYQTPSQIHFMSAPFLSQVLGNMNNIVQKSTKYYKFHMYSAHDTTVWLFLLALNQTSSQCLVEAYLNQEVSQKNCQYNYPGFASNIIFELYEDEKKSNYVKIMYNGTYFNPCPQVDSQQCPLETFQQNLQGQFSDYNVGCGIEGSQNTIETKAPTWLWILFGISLGFAVISFVFACYSYQKWRKVIAPGGYTDNI